MTKKTPKRPKSSKNPIKDRLDNAEKVTLSGGGSGESATGVDGGSNKQGARPDDQHLTACSKFPETDIGNGKRLLERHRDQVLQVANVGIHVFDDKSWVWDETGTVSRRLAHETVEKIGDERLVLAGADFELDIIASADARGAELKTLVAIKAGDRSSEQVSAYNEIKTLMARADEVRSMIVARKKSRSRHAKASAGSSKIDNMIREASPYITHKIDEMDKDPLALNCQNGTIEFFEEKSGGTSIWDVRLRDHKRTDLLTKCAQANFNLDAQAVRFEEFLETMIPDFELRDFIQRYLGYCATGLTHEQVFAFFHGGGRNGKSTLVDIICRILANYTTTVPIETLAGDQRRKGGDATPDLMRLPGARLVRASEPESSMKFREAMIKSLTSDEPILIRALHKDFNEIYPTFKLIISGNHKPRIDNDDNGMWRRVLLVPWDVKLPRDQIDKGLGKKLWNERDGIFAWIIRGVLSYLEQGLNPPSAVLEATKEYRAESNPIGAFLDSCCVFSGDLKADRMAPGELFAAYDLARAKQGWAQFHPTTFTKRLPDQAVARGAVRQKTNGLMVYAGVSLIDGFDVEFADERKSKQMERYT